MDLAEKTDDGGTKEQFLKNQAANFFSPLDKRIEAERQLEKPELADSLRYLIDFFRELQQRRESNGFAIVPLNIDRWARRKGIDLASWEYDVLDELDLMVMRRASETTKQADKDLRKVRK